MARGFEESYLVALHVTVVAPEIVGVEKQKNASASLIADGTGLLGRGRLRKKEAGAPGVRRSDNEPALVIGKGRVLDEREAHGFGEEGERFVVVAYK